jgi:predicted phosphodiesterase
MRYALISDIHANRPALEAVLADIATRGSAYAVLHLGDLVGYAPWPNETVQLIREAGIFGVAGNYDSTTATNYKHCGCKYEDPEQEALSHRSYDWTRKHVSTETRQFLSSLPFRIDLRPLGGHVSGPTITLVHGNATLNTVYVTEDRSDTFLERMAQNVGARAGDVICFGHTHKPWHRIVNEVQFINTGSVGRPKDGDWRAGYVLLNVNTSDGKTIITPEFVRVEYDVCETVKAIRASELPDEFGEYLLSGGNSSNSP